MPATTALSGNSTMALSIRRCWQHRQRVCPCLPAYLSFPRARKMGRSNFERVRVGHQMVVEPVFNRPSSAFPACPVPFRLAFSSFRVFVSPIDAGIFYNARIRSTRAVAVWISPASLAIRMPGGNRSFRAKIARLQKNRGSRFAIGTPVAYS